MPDGSNFILETDSYKHSHWRMLPADLEKVYMYGEPRYSKEGFTEVVWFGLQYYIKKYLRGKVVTMDDVEEAESVIKHHMGEGVFNRVGWEYIVNRHEGRLPIEIKALPEGTIAPLRTPLYTVENTDRSLPWLPGFIETKLMKVWYPTTVATLSREFLKILTKYLTITDEAQRMKEVLPFIFHDFGYRGSTSEESAGIGGMAHLLNSNGTDTLKAIEYAQRWYQMQSGTVKSVPAMEHSVVMPWQHEQAAYSLALGAFEDTILSMVVDTWDQQGALRDIFAANGTDVKEMIQRRERPVAIRLDSGDPAEEIIAAYRQLAKGYGDHLNRKGYSILNKIVILQGDGMDVKSLPRILDAVTSQKIAASNLVFGCGSGLLQKVTRDTLGFAQKPSYGETSGGKAIFMRKNPKGDSQKASMEGLLVVKENPDGSLRTFQGLTREDSAAFAPVNLMRTVFLDGGIHNEDSFYGIKERLSWNKLMVTS